MIVRRLHRSGRSDAGIIAIILTEMHFRGPFHRLIEFLVWRVLSLFRLHRADTISIGLGQVQVRHWPHPPRLGDTTCPLFAYDLVAGRLGQFDQTDSCLRQRVARHVGEVRSHYFQIVQQYYRAIEGPNKTDAGNGSKASCRVSNVLRSPSPDPRR